MNSLIYKDDTYKIVGACFEVYNELGNGFLEDVYQEALEIELRERGIPAMPQVQLPIRYKNHLLKKRYLPDFIAHEKIIIEIKAAANLSTAHRAQVYNYLKATGYQLGLLINFGHAGELEYQRIVKSR